MAKRSLESERRHKSSDQILQGYYHNQVATKWAVQRVADGPQIDWGVLQIFGFYLNTNDMDYTATWKQRHRYESTITLAMTTKDRQCGPTDALIGLQQEQGRQNSYTPKNERSEQRPFDEELQAKLEWLSQNWMTHFAQSSSSSSSSQNWWQHEHEHQDSQWHEHQNTQWRDHQWQDHQWEDHDWSEDLARNWRQSAQVPSEDQQDYQWKDREWWLRRLFIKK